MPNANLELEESGTSFSKEPHFGKFILGVHLFEFRMGFYKCQCVFGLCMLIWVSSVLPFTYFVDLNFFLFLFKSKFYYRWNGMCF